MPDDPIQPPYHTFMNALAEAIDHLLNGDEDPKGLAFCLLVCRFGDIKEGRVNYISNANRPDMLAMMAEYLARQEKQS
jgi:hypothetical protein